MDELVLVDTLTATHGRIFECRGHLIPTWSPRGYGWAGRFPGSWAWL